VDESSLLRGSLVRERAKKPKGENERRNGEGWERKEGEGEGRRRAC